MGKSLRVCTSRAAAFHDFQYDGFQLQNRELSASC